MTVSVRAPSYQHNLFSEEPIFRTDILPRRRTPFSRNRGLGTGARDLRAQIDGLSSARANRAFESCGNGSSVPPLTEVRKPRTVVFGNLLDISACLLVRLRRALLKHS